MTSRVPESLWRPLAAGVAAVVLAGCAAPTPVKAADKVQVAPVKAERHARAKVDAGSATPNRLQVLAVDDRVRPFANIDDKDVPRDIELEIEDAPVGLDASGGVRTIQHRYAVAHTRRGETAKQTRARLLRWLAHVDLPAGERFAVQDKEAPLPDLSRFVPTGARSYVVEGPSIVTSADIAGVDARFSRTQFDCRIRISLTDGGAQRFLDATRRLVHHRIAILVDGVVENAPIVMSPIPGGHLFILLDPTSATCPVAHKIAASLRSSAPGLASRRHRTFWLWR